ncbi:MAG: O-antigen ligase family protein [Candidatus Firestonebacteria bacterium]
MTLSNVSLLLSLSCVVLTGSKGGALAVFAASAVFLLGLIVLAGKKLISEKTRFTVTVTALLLLLLFVLLPNPLLFRIQNAGIGDKLAFERIGIFKSAVMMFKDKPLTGQGLGVFSDAYNSYKLPVEGVAGRYGRHAEFAHNEYLNVAAELGIAGLLLFSAIVIVVLRRAYLSVKYAETRTTALTALGALAALAAVFSQAIVDFNLRFLPIMLLSALSAAVVWSPIFIPASHPKITRRIRIYFSVFIILTFVVILFVFLGQVRTGAAGKEEREKALTEALLLDPLNAGRADALGLYYLDKFVETKDRAVLSLAQKHFKSAVSKNKVNGYYRKHLGHAYAACNMFPEAEKEYLEAIKLCRYEPFFRVELCDLYFYMINYSDLYNLMPYRAKAEYQLLEALKIEPNYVLARVKLGRLYMDSGQMNKGIYQLKLAESTYRNVVADPSSSYEERLLRRP